MTQVKSLVLSAALVCGFAVTASAEKKEAVEAVIAEGDVSHTLTADAHKNKEHAKKVTHHAKKAAKPHAEKAATHKPMMPGENGTGLPPKYLDDKATENTLPAEPKGETNDN